MHSLKSRSDKSHASPWIALMAILTMVFVGIQLWPGSSPTNLYASTQATVTVPPTWTGAIPTANHTPEYDGYPTVAASFWNATSTPNGGLATPTVIPSKTP